MRQGKVTRHAGSYALGETSLGLVRERDAGPTVKCGFTAADFQAMKWTDREETVSMDVDVRMWAKEGFEAKDFFTTSGAFKTMTRKADPYGPYPGGIFSGR